MPLHIELAAESHQQSLQAANVIVKECFLFLFLRSMVNERRKVCMPIEVMLVVIMWAQYFRGERGGTAPSVLSGKAGLCSSVSILLLANFYMVQ